LVSNLESLEQEKLQNPKKGFDFSGVIKFVILLIFMGYFYSIFFGESSIGVLLDAKDREAKLVTEYNKLQNENQKLQKKHFELIQLTPQEDSF